MGFLVCNFYLGKGFQNSENTNSIFLQDNNGDIFWLNKSPVIKVTLNNNNIQIGRNTLPFKKDTVGKSVFNVPLREAVWKNYFITYLENNSNAISEDSVLIWQNTKAKIFDFVNTDIKQYQSIPNWKRLSDVQQICHVFVNKLAKNNNVIINNQSFSIISNGFPQQLYNAENYFIQRKSEPNNIPILILLTLLTSMFGLSILGIYQTKNVSNLNSVIIENIVEVLNTPHIETQIPNIDKLKISDLLKNETSEIERYLKKFHDRYGNLYFDLQKTKERLSEEQKQNVKQKLIEMGLHAYSLSEAYMKAGEIKNLEKYSLNVSLILNNKKATALDTNSFILFEDHPEKIEVSYRNFQKILQELNIGSLEGVLLNDKYLVENKFLA
jgi:hypothetical protein